MVPVKNRLAKYVPDLSSWAIISLFTSNETEGILLIYFDLLSHYAPRASGLIVTKPTENSNKPKIVPRVSLTNQFKP